MVDPRQKVPEWATKLMTISFPEKSLTRTTNECLRLTPLDDGPNPTPQGSSGTLGLVMSAICRKTEEETHVALTLAHNLDGYNRCQIIHPEMNTTIILNVSDQFKQIGLRGAQCFQGQDPDKLVHEVTQLHGLPNRFPCGLFQSYPVDCTILLRNPDPYETYSKDPRFLTFKNLRRNLPLRVFKDGCTTKLTSGILRRIQVEGCGAHTGEVVWDDVGVPFAGAGDSGAQVYAVTVNGKIWLSKELPPMNGDILQCPIGIHKGSEVSEEGEGVSICLLLAWVVAVLNAVNPDEQVFFCEHEE